MSTKAGPTGLVIGRRGLCEELGFDAAAGFDRDDLRDHRPDAQCGNNPRDHRGRGQY